jgi:Transmembrane secretion effector
LFAKPKQRWPAGRPFRVVWAGEVGSVLGDYAYQVAFAWLVLSVSHSAAVLAEVMICNVVCSGVLVLVGGVVTDRWSPRLIMLCSHLSKGILVGVLCLLTADHAVHMWSFFAIASAFGIADSFFWPASGSILPSLVSTEELPTANAIVAVGEQTAVFIGPVIGGLLVSIFSPAAAFALDALTFFVAAWTVTRAPRTVPHDAEQNEWSIQTLVSSVKEGLSYARGQPQMGAILVVIAASTLAYSGLFAVALPAFAHGVGHSVEALGIMVACWGAGQLAGSMSASVTGLPARWGMLILGMSVCEGISFLAIGWTSSLAVAYALLVILGFGVAYSSDVAIPTWIQVSTTPEVLGRVNSIINLPRILLQPASIAAMGALAVVSVRLPFFFAAGSMLLAGIALAAAGTLRQLGVTKPDLDHTPVGGLQG